MHTQPQQPLHHVPALTPSPLKSQSCNITSPTPHTTTCPLTPPTRNPQLASSQLAELSRTLFIFVSNPSSFVSTTSCACFCPLLLATFPNWLSLCHCPLTFPCFFLFSHYLHVRYVERQYIRAWEWWAECDATGRPITMVFTGWRDGASSMVGGL